METTPSAAELVEAATEAIRTELLPALSGRASFQARVAMNVLETARRELLGAPAADAAERARLLAVLAAVPQEGASPASVAGADAAASVGAAPSALAEVPLPELRRALCDAVRDGRADLATPGLADHLWADVLARVAIDQPAYPSFVRERAVGPAGVAPADPATDRTHA